MRLRPSILLVCVASILLAAAPAGAQFPQKFTNLKVFPEETSARDLEQNMRGFAFALNVRCPYCHVQNADGKFDYAADDKQTKKTARIMLQMVASINRDFVGKIAKPNPMRVECVTCHHGLTQPRQLKAVLEEALDQQGLSAAIALYQDLRKQYYGSGQYDFGETTLNQVTEWLLAQRKNKEAAAIMEMNFAANSPQSMWAFHMLAMAHEANGEKDKAREDYRRVVELHPEDSWAREQVKRLSSAKEE
jgi:tetratricopeptide (TPR) repeat protein